MNRPEDDLGFSLPAALPASAEIDPWCKAAEIFRNTYCDMVPGKRRWLELTHDERITDIVCLQAAFAALRSHPQAPASGEGVSGRARKLIEAAEAVVTLSDLSPSNRGKTLVAVRIDPAKVGFIGFCEAMNEVLDVAARALSPSQPASGAKS